MPVPPLFASFYKRSHSEGNDLLTIKPSILKNTLLILHSIYNLKVIRQCFLFKIYLLKISFTNFQLLNLDLVVSFHYKDYQVLLDL